MVQPWLTKPKQSSATPGNPRAAIEVATAYQVNDGKDSVVIEFFSKQFHACMIARSTVVSSEATPGDLDLVAIRKQLVL